MTSAFRRSGAFRSQNMSAAWRHVDFALCGLVLATATFGSAMVYSATRNFDDPTEFIEKHVLFVILGMCAMAATATIDYVKLRDWARLVYVVGIVGLVLVITPLGSVHNGIRAWFDVGPIQIQPSEVAKVAVIVALASFLGTVADGLGARQLLIALAMLGVPMGLILLQPDLGTDLVYLMMGAAMLLVAGFPAKYLAALGLVGILAVAGILTSDTLDQYQTDRLTSFINPDASPSQATYNVEQAQIAISAGGVLGQGYGSGKQTTGGFVPEQETDFIFTVAGEELGFLGSALLLLLEGGIVWRIWRTATMARDQVGLLICVGVMAVFVFHIFQNVGMNLGIMPVTGIPLPLISYGGSATIMMFASLGLVMNVHMRRFS